MKGVFLWVDQFACLLVDLDDLGPLGIVSLLSTQGVLLDSLQCEGPRNFRKRIQLTNSSTDFLS